MDGGDIPRQTEGTRGRGAARRQGRAIGQGQVGQHVIGSVGKGGGSRRRRRVGRLRRDRHAYVRVLGYGCAHSGVLLTLLVCPIRQLNQLMYSAYVYWSVTFTVSVSPVARTTPVKSLLMNRLPTVAASKEPALVTVSAPGAVKAADCQVIVSLVTDVVPRVGVVFTRA